MTVVGRATTESNKEKKTQINVQNQEWWKDTKIAKTFADVTMLENR